MTEVWKTNLPTTEKMVLLVIADHANEDGTEAWPSQATIAAKCSITVRTVQRSVNTLVKHKYIFLEKRAGGSLNCREDRRPNKYTINLKRLRGDNMTGRQDDANEVTMTPPTGRQSRPMKHPTDTPIDTPDFQEFWKMYPRKTARGAALKAWASAIQKTTPAAIIAGAKKYAQDKDRDPKYTAYPATWLNQERWLDEAPTAEQGQARPTPQAFSYNEAIHGPNKDAVPMPVAIKEFLDKALRK